MAEIAASVRDNPRTAVKAGHGVSKRLDLDTPILTDRGFIPMRDVQVGDKVYSEAGELVPVTGLSPIEFAECYEVRFDDGSSLVTSGDHLWSVHTFLQRKRLRRSGCRDYRQAWDSTVEMTTDEIRQNLTHNGQANISIPTAMPLVGKRDVHGSEAQSVRRTMRIVRSVTPVGKKDVRCLGVDSSRHLFLAGRDLIPTHNSFSLSGLALWFLYSFPPATVVTTAPTQNQVEGILWREIRQHHARAKIPLGGHLTTTKLDLQQETGIKWFATGFSCRPDTVTQEATAFHGYHNDNVLIQFDEAAGILPEIWRAAEHIGGNKVTRFVAVGNPTSATGDFVRCFKDPGFHCMTIPVTSTPNYIEGSNRIPGVYGRDYEARIISKYGRDSDEYRVRVLGEISSKAHPGAYYATQLQWLRDNGRIRKVEYNPQFPVFTVWDPGFTTAFWTFQPSPAGLWHFLRYYEASGEDMAQYAALLQRWSDEYGYRYGQHFAPFDVNNNQYKLVSADGLMEVAARAGLRFTQMEMERSVDGGIERTREFLRACVFDTEGCDLGLDRLAGYCQKVNRSMSSEERLVYIAHPEKNGCEHGCLVAGTLVKTTRGEVPIEQVQVDDRVVTPSGSCKVLASGPSRVADKLLRITTTQGREIVCTPEHRIFRGDSLVQAGGLRLGDTVQAWTLGWRALWQMRRLFSTGSRTGYRDGITKGDQSQAGTVTLSGCMLRCGSSIMDLFRRGVTSIISMGTPAITPLAILPACRNTNICLYMPESLGGQEATRTSDKSERRLNWQNNGTVARRDWNGIVNTASKLGSIVNGIMRRASTVGMGTVHRCHGIPSSVVANAATTHETSEGQTMSRAFARCAARLSSAIDTLRQERVAAVVDVPLVTGEVVYDLTVEHDHCYFANGILVSNSDAMRYASKAVGRIDPTFFLSQFTEQVLVRRNRHDAGTRHTPMAC